MKQVQANYILPPTTSIDGAEIKVQQYNNNCNKEHYFIDFLLLFMAIVFIAFIILKIIKKI